MNGALNENDSLFGQITNVEELRMANGLFNNSLLLNFFANQSGLDTIVTRGSEACRTITLPPWVSMIEWNGSTGTTVSARAGAETASERTGATRAARRGTGNRLGECEWRMEASIGE